MPIDRKIIPEGQGQGQAINYFNERNLFQAIIIIILLTVSNQNV